MTILELVEHDHQRLWSYLQQLESVDEAQRPQAVTRLERFVRDYLLCDHEVFFGVLDAPTPQTAAIAEARAELQHLLSLVAQLRSAEGQEAALAEIRAALTRHAVRERDDIIPLVRQRCTTEQLMELFERAQERRNHQSPTDNLIFPADRFGIE